MNDPQPSGSDLHELPGPGRPGDDEASALLAAWTQHRELAASVADLPAYADGLVRLSRDVSGCACVALRRAGPAGFLSSLAAIGFPPDFVAAEEEVSVRNDDCACVRALRGDAPPAGLDGLPGAAAALVCPDLSRAAREFPDVRHAFRNRCLDPAFRTFAAFPVPVRGRAEFLLVLADPRPGILSGPPAARIASLLPLVSETLARLDAEAEVSTYRRRMSLMAQAIPLPLWVVGPDRQVLFQNAAHQALFGLMNGDRKCHQHLVGGNAPCPGCSLPRVQAGETVHEHLHLPGVKRSFDVLSVPMERAEGMCMVQFFLDATDRLQAESMLRQSQRMESLGSLAAGIAHDFNNILAGVSGFAQLGEMRAPQDPSIAEPFRQIRAMADRGAELTRKILAFSRRQPLRVVPLDLNALVRSMQPMLGPLVGDLVSVHLDLAPRLWAVQADQGALEQVLFNLCTNAVEAMAGGGTMVISTANLPPEDFQAVLPSDRPMNGVALRVRDTGCGMTREVVDHIFEPFFTTKGRGRGTGLGLAVTYGIVRQLGGVVTVDSSVGQGTTMSIFLPATSVTPSRIVRPKEAPPPPSTDHRGRAIVIEDEVAIRELVASMLRRMGFEVVGAASADEGLKVILSSVNGFDLVVSDVAMPGMNGCDLARRVTSLRPSTAVLLMTGCSDEHLDQYGLSDAMNVLRKPFDLDSLAARVEKLVAGLPQ